MSVLTPPTSGPLKTASTDITEAGLVHFYNVLPVPLADSPHSGRVWNCNLVLFRGKHYVIRAESGRGKTTFLNIIYGLRKDYRGEAFFNETNLRSLSADDFAACRRSVVSYLFQDLRLFGDLTARENIQLSPGNNLSGAEIEYWADKLGVLQRLDKPCRTLSLGQQQRMALIRALGQPFQWLLLDEPFSHLDDRHAGLAMELIMKRASELNASVIATSLGDTSLFQGFDTVEL